MVYEEGKRRVRRRQRKVCMWIKYDRYSIRTKIDLQTQMCSYKLISANHFLDIQFWVEICF